MASLNSFLQGNMGIPFSYFYSLLDIAKCTNILPILISYVHLMNVLILLSSGLQPFGMEKRREEGRESHILYRTHQASSQREQYESLRGFAVPCVSHKEEAHTTSLAFP